MKGKLGAFGGPPRVVTEGVLPTLMGELVSMNSLGDGKRVENKKRLGSGMTSAKEAGEGLSGRVKIGMFGGEMCGQVGELGIDAVSKDE